MNNNLGKNTYCKIITEFVNKNTNELLKLVKKYQKLAIKSIIRQTLIHTQNFDFAIRLNDVNDSVVLRELLTEIFATKLQRINAKQLKELYDKSSTVKDIKKHEIYQMFKPLFAGNLGTYNLIFFKYINSNLINNLNGGLKHTQQTWKQIRFYLSIINLNDNIIDSMLRVIIENKVYIDNIHINVNEFVITNNYTGIPKTFEDIELESLLLHKLKGKVTKNNIITIYEKCCCDTENINDLKTRTKILMKLLC